MATRRSLFAMNTWRCLFVMKSWHVLFAPRNAALFLFAEERSLGCQAWLRYPFPVLAEEREEDSKVKN